jgi:hypothetical protein
MPVRFPPGPPTAQTGVWEDGPGIFQNPANSGPPVRYTGQDQTGIINTATPYPGAPWERGCGAADPAMSNVNIQAPSGTGYRAKGVGKVGTINAGISSPVTQPVTTVQVRMYKGSDGNLYVLDNDNNTYMVSAGGALKPVPPVYSPN